MNTFETLALAISPSDRRHLISLAYGYLGTLADSEDLVQEALLKFAEADHGKVHNPPAWLTTVLTRLAIDKLRSAQHRRETYTGEWLPEPVYNAPDAEQQAITRSRLSVGLLYLLEKLEPEQRAVFVLREVFEYAYSAIGGIVGKSEAACRQLMTRARAALERARQAPAADHSAVSPLVATLIDALQRGDEQALLRILAPDAILVADGGGRVASVLNPLYGADPIKRFFMGLLRKFANSFAWQAATVNGAPGLLTYRDGALVSVGAFDVKDGRITAIYSVGNPDKMRGGIPSQ